jgi:hypothetical protein
LRELSQTRTPVRVLQVSTQHRSVAILRPLSDCDRVDGAGGGAPVTSRPVGIFYIEEPIMPGDTAATGAFQVNIPTGLVDELKRNRVVRPSPLKVDGMKPSLLDRLFGHLADEKSRRR